MGLWDTLFGRGKKPKRHGRGSPSDDQTDGYTRQIQKPSDGEFDATPPEPAGGGWGAQEDPWAPTQVPQSHALPPLDDPSPIPRGPAPPQRGGGLARSTPHSPTPIRPIPVPRGHGVRSSGHTPTGDVEDDATVMPGMIKATGPAGRIVAVLVGVDGPLLNHIHALYEGENMLGRGDPLDGGLPDDTKSISRTHAKIIEAGRDFMLQPLRAENVTFVNDQAVDASQLLTDGDRIRLGAAQPSTFVFRTVP
jgi:hypothetical protein